MVQQIDIKQTIGKTEYKELVGELLASIVSDTNSPFMEVVDKYSDYLDTAVDLDQSQKAGAMANFLKDSYAQINNQAMSQAMELMTTNARLLYESYSVAAAYNKAKEDLKQAESNSQLAAKAVVAKDKEMALLDEKLVIDKLDAQIKRATLTKQYGVVPNIQVVKGLANGNYYKEYQSVPYITNEAGDYIDNAGEVVTNPDYYVQAVFDTTVSENVTLVNTPDKGAIDKQIRGYDVINYKDVLKTMDQRTALMQNAKIPESEYEAKNRVNLMQEILGDDVVLDINANGTMKD